MEETLLACAPAILAVVLAVVLRVLRSRKEASEEIAALQKKLAALKQRNRQLEQELSQARERAFVASLREQRSARSEPPVSPPHSRELAPHSWPFTPSEKEVDEAFHRLQAIKTLLPLDDTVEHQYVAEVDTIAKRLELATGMDLSRWLGVSQQVPQSEVTSRGRETEVLSLGDHVHSRGLFRFKILSLLAFCNYQMCHSEPPPGFHPPGPWAARRIH